LVGLSYNSLMAVSMLEIDKKILKKSYSRLIISGSMAELYEYEEPYFWNTPPPVKNLNPPCKEKKERRDDNLNRARQHIRRLIMANIGESPPVFLTLTFKQNLKDLKVANHQFTNYIKRLNRFIGFKAKYITIIEFQKRGAIHYHSVYFNLPFIKINILEHKIWKQGWTNIQAIKEKDLTKIKHVGAYISKYLEKQNIDKRLIGQKCYFTSRNIKHPEEYKKKENIDKILEHITIKETYQSVVESQRYGIIKYKQMTYANKN